MARTWIKGKEEISQVKYYNPFYKEFESKINIAFNKITNVAVGVVKKFFTTIILLTVFSWLNIHNTNFVKGVSALINLEATGFALIFNWEDNKNTIVEAWQVGAGIDYSWSEYKKKTGYDLSDKFVYWGKGVSVMKDVVTLNGVIEDCKEDCNKPAFATKTSEAIEFCEETYGAKLLSESDAENILGKHNPILRINKRDETPEWTSTVNPKDGDDYFVYFKEAKKPEDFIKESYNKEGFYLDEDSYFTMNIAFRCIAKLPY